MGDHTEKHIHFEDGRNREYDGSSDEDCKAVEVRSYCRQYQMTTKNGATDLIAYTGRLRSRKPLSSQKLNGCLRDQSACDAPSFAT